MNTKSTDSISKRDGSVLIAVLAVAMIVGVASMTTMMAVRMERATLMEASDVAQARLNAQSAIHIGLEQLNTDPDWRFNHSNGVWKTDVPVASGSFSLVGIDPTDGNLQNGLTDPLILRGVGRQNRSVQKSQITVLPKTSPLDSLRNAAQAGGNITFNNANVASSGTFGANGNVNETGVGGVDAKVEASGTVSGDGFQGPVTSGSVPRKLPDVSDVFGYYLRNGTRIDISNVISPAPPSPPPLPNLLDNPGFEDGTSGWTGYHCSLSHDESSVGKNSIRVNNRLNRIAGPIQEVSKLLSEPGMSFDIHARVRTKMKTNTFSILVHILSKDGNSRWFYTPSVTQVGTAWDLVTETFQLTWNDTGLASAHVIICTPYGTTNDFDIDNVVMFPTGAESYDNLLEQYDMEDDPLSVWYAIGCSIEKTSHAKYGDQAIQTDGRSKIKHTIAQDITDRIDNGAEYFTEAWTLVRSHSSHARIYIHVESTGDGLQEIPMTPNVLSSSFRYAKVSGQNTVQWSGNLIKAEWIVKFLNTSNADIQIDHAVLRLVNHPPPDARTMDRIVLSPSVNPFGHKTTNSRGIYVINCRDQDITIRRSRLAATLVLLAPGPGSKVDQKGIVWEPAVPNFPCLMVDGSLTIRTANRGLDEDNEMMNFNPPGTPYPFRGTNEDVDTTDNYLPIINGLVYSSQNLYFDGDVNLVGSIILEGDWNVQGNLKLSHHPVHQLNPPPGFSFTTFDLKLNSVRKSVD